MIGLNYEWKQQKKASWVLADKEDIWFRKQQEKNSKLLQMILAILYVSCMYSIMLYQVYI